LLVVVKTQLASKKTSLKNRHVVWVLGAKFWPLSPRWRKRELLNSFFLLVKKISIRQRAVQRERKNSVLIGFFESFNFFRRPPRVRGAWTCNSCFSQDWDPKRNLCPRVALSSTREQTSRFQIRSNRLFHAILGEEEDVRNRGEGVCPVPPRTPQETNLNWISVFRKLGPPSKTWYGAPQTELSWTGRGIWYFFMVEKI
jgi:hypothetical protein